MVYDLNDALAHRRQSLVDGLRQQIDQVDEQIERVQKQREDILSAQKVLDQMEAVLRRMSMLAREAASKEERRPMLLSEFEACKLEVDTLSQRAVLYGFNLVKDRADVVRAVIDALIQQW